MTLKREPAVIIGIVISILAAVQQWLSSTQDVSWRSLLPVVAGILIRQFVTPVTGTTDNTVK